MWDYLTISCCYVQSHISLSYNSLTFSYAGTGYQLAIVFINDSQRVQSWLEVNFIFGEDNVLDFSYCVDWPVINTDFTWFETTHSQKEDCEDESLFAKLKHLILV